MRLTPTLLILAASVILNDPAQAQPVKPPPKDLPPAAAELWPFPPPDPAAWWDDKRPAPPPEADPLGGRRQGRTERPIPIDSGVDASTYRLWGLPPLQWQLLRGPEMIVEVWVRPARTVRQSVARVVVRRDGKAFVQGRAGLACCEPGIARRMGFDAELPASRAATLLALRDDPLWSAPRDVRVSEGADVVEQICVDGTAYDLTLVVPGQSRSVRRACDPDAIGQAADVLEAVLGAALGHDPRFDILFPKAADFGPARAAYKGLLAHGGTLKPDPKGRAQPPGVPPAPDEP